MSLMQIVGAGLVLSGVLLVTLTREATTGEQQ
jgi:drug/metabolite transporter (DMT)-like permease